MAMIRINDLARELKIKSGRILEVLPLVGVTEKKTHSSALEEWQADKVREYILGPAAESPTLPRPIRTEAIKLEIQSDTILRPGDILKAIMSRKERTNSDTVRLEPLPPISHESFEHGTKGGFRPSIADGGLPAEGKNSALRLPEGFSFYTRGFVDFDHVLQHFNWNFKGQDVSIDMTACARSNFQALALLVQYAWYATLNGCTVRFKYGTAQSGPTKMLTNMGALDWRYVLLNDGRDFSNSPTRKTYALRRRSDVQSTINNARRAIRNYTIGFPEYLSYIISELLYNATEHGRRTGTAESCHVLVPSIFQFGLYTQLNRLSFLFSDLGMGVKAHLEQSYPPFPTHQDAIMYALRPNVSGTFRQQSQPYATQNNAGMGLTYSSLMLKRLKGDMYIVSHNAVVHVSPEDVTSHQIKSFWPGTFVLINLNVGEAPSVSLEDLIGEIRICAQREVDGASRREETDRYVVSMFNYFGKYAEDKDAAITFRDRRLLPAIENEKKIDLDFRDVETAPHSFLNALLATPIRRLGMKAYQRIRIYNAPGPIHEIFDKVIEDNLPRIQ